MSKMICLEKEKIENYQLAKADNFKGWVIHHRLETHNSDGERRLVIISKAELIALDMYYNRPASELIYLTRSEHAYLHGVADSDKINKLIRSRIGTHNSVLHMEAICKSNSEKYSKKVRCIETNEIFASVKDAGKKYKNTHISAAALGKRKTAANLHWEYV